MTNFPTFAPHRLLRSGHLQTIVCPYLRPANGSGRYRAEQRIVQLDDGDRLVLHDDCPAGWRGGDRVALLIHGVAGCHLSSYLVRITAKMNRAGIRTFRMDLRGCGAGLQLARLPGHAGRSEDAAAALAVAAKLCPTSPVTMIGFSLGGNIALKLASEVGDEPSGHLDSVLAVGPPIDLSHCARKIERGVNRIYSRNFTRSLVRYVHQRQRCNPEFPKVSLRPLPKGIVEFDDRITAPLSGFSGAEQYYRQSSCAPGLPKIKLPTLIITAADDPIIPVEMFRRARLSPSIDLRITQHGGHVAFLGAGGVDADRWWLDWRIIDWVRNRAS